jgi:hypothetical protein
LLDLAARTGDWSLLREADPPVDGPADRVGAWVAATAGVELVRIAALPSATRDEEAAALAERLRPFVVRLDGERSEVADLLPLLVRGLAAVQAHRAGGDEEESADAVEKYVLSAASGDAVPALRLRVACLLLLGLERAASAVELARDGLGRVAEGERNAFGLFAAGLWMAEAVRRGEVAWLEAAEAELARLRGLSAGDRPSPNGGDYDAALARLLELQVAWVDAVRAAEPAGLDEVARRTVVFLEGYRATDPGADRVRSALHLALAFVAATDPDDEDGPAEHAEWARLLAPGTAGPEYVAALAALRAERFQVAQALAFRALDAAETPAMEARIHKLGAEVAQAQRDVVSLLSHLRALDAIWAAGGDEDRGESWSRLAVDGSASLGLGTSETEGIRVDATLSPLVLPFHHIRGVDRATVKRYLGTLGGAGGEE